jgi:hypothetical protein
MSADSPPTYYFTGIQFNSAFYVDASTAPLTQTQASALYLLKNSADTATALETFTGGILTNSISPTTTASTISLISSKTGSTDADPAIAIATSDLTRTIKLGNESATNQNSVHLASLDVTFNNLNNITGTTGIVQVGNKQTTSAGVLNLGCSTAGNVRVDAPINLGTDSTMTGVITIGSSNATQSTVVKNADVRMGTAKNITLQPTAGYAVPTADTMLGGITTGTFSTPASSFSANKDIATISLVKGTYMVFFSFQANYATLPTTNYITLSGTSVGTPTVIFGNTSVVAGAIAFHGSFPASISTAGTLILLYNIVGTINNITIPSYRAVRIA